MATKDEIRIFIDNVKASPLDPIRWQALGKGLGWNSWAEVPLEIRLQSGREKHDWLMYAKQYFELKLTGGNEEKFWEELLT